jgi:hypothetical protein
MINWGPFLKIAAKVLGVIVTALTPEIRDMVSDTIKGWEAKAEETENPWDDHFVAILKEILGIK